MASISVVAWNDGGMQQGELQRSVVCGNFGGNSQVHNLDCGGFTGI